MHIVAAIFQLRTSRLLLADVDAQPEPVRELESNFPKNKERTPEYPSDVVAVHPESPSKYEYKGISLQDGKNLSYSDDNHILEENKKEQLLKCVQDEQEVETNQEQLNPPQQEITNVKMINAADHKKNFGQVLKDIKTMKVKALNAEITNVMEYKKRIDKELEKINMMLEKFKEQKIMNAEVRKMKDRQKALRGTSYFIKKKCSADVPSGVDSMEGITETEGVVLNPVRMIDSRIEKTLFRTFNYIDECEHNPNITKTQYRLLKIKKYGSILALPFLIALSSLGFYADVSLHWVIFVFCALSFIIFFYILVKTLKYDLKSHGIRKPLFMDYVRSFKRCIK
ncbi:hypothetical protein AK88_05325 [Plasmodium fragile]|uniref:Pv-fam-b protein n=1 Tax=Plasmodium fragile TaxID=5857 RepID=A0A0D9QH36_PLAFR|nr:uncharacterized protein AK88_05325 [Plasmodium fragile]KJP85041.1 hypothetical protein AK88_05325 [Plasmodium fragile]